MHPFAQLYTWAVCREPCTKLGMNWEQHILRLHWMVHVVVHIEQFINKSNVKYKPYGPWGHFLGQCTLIPFPCGARGAQEAFPKGYSLDSAAWPEAPSCLPFRARGSNSSADLPRASDGRI